MQLSPKQVHSPSMRSPETHHPARTASVSLVFGRLINTNESALLLGIAAKAHSRKVKRHRLCSVVAARLSVRSPRPCHLQFNWANANKLFANVSLFVIILRLFVRSAERNINNRPLDDREISKRCHSQAIYVFDRANGSIECLRND